MISSTHVKKSRSAIGNPPHRKPKKIIIPHRLPSVVLPSKPIIYITADKLTCEECGCYPKEDPYVRGKKINPCQKSPLTLYEIAAKAVDNLKFPEAFQWSVDDVVQWMENSVGLSRYRECIIDNYIDGKRLLMLEDPSKLPEINIHDFQHIKRIVASVQQLYGMDFLRFSRSIVLPMRRPLIYCNWFKSRTGPNWGIRQNWTRSDLLSWMKIIEPAPIHRDHWDLVWYQKPDFPRALFGRVHMPKVKSFIPMYMQPKPETCTEYLAPRKFRLQKSIPESHQLIWMQHHPNSPEAKALQKNLMEKTKPQKVKKYKFLIKDSSRLIPKKVDLNGLKGQELVLARRLKPRDKFLMPV